MRNRSGAGPGGGLERNLEKGQVGIGKASVVRVQPEEKWVCAEKGVAASLDSKVWRGRQAQVGKAEARRRDKEADKTHLRRGQRQRNDVYEGRTSDDSIMPQSPK
jgi:hypothetical protein